MLNSNYLGKLIHSVIFGFVFGLVLVFAENFEQKEKNTKKLSNKKDTRLVLTQPQNYSRDQIVHLGREALRCRLTAGNAILTDPVVYIDGVSYEKKSIAQENNPAILYENRVLKEFIEKYRLINKP